MKEIKVQLRHAAIDAPLECTMRVCDDEFFIENENFSPIEIENTRFVPVEESRYKIIRSFLSLHKEEWNLLVERRGFRKNLPPIYEKIRQNNSRQWEKQRKKQQKQ